MSEVVPLAAAPAPVPYPTLYSGQTDRGPSKLGAIELLLYNMASMLASVAAGYDVRLSNVSPVHPSLGPGGRAAEYEPSRSGSAHPPLYPHKTYHGSTPHHRTPLPALSRPLRFTDSPQHTAVGRPGRAGRSPDSDVTVQPPPPVATGPGLDRPLFLPPPDYNESPSAYTMVRTARFYADQLEGDVAPAHYRGPAQPQPGLAFSNPGYERTERPHCGTGPGRVTFQQRSYSASGERGYSELEPPPLAPRRLSRGSLQQAGEVERPNTLELAQPRTPLRSSLKKSSRPGRSSPWAAGWGSGGGTPTAETTPTNSSDSAGEAGGGYPLCKTDSGFVSNSRLVR